MHLEDLSPTSQICLAVGAGLVLLALIGCLFGPTVYRACARRTWEMPKDNAAEVGLFRGAGAEFLPEEMNDQEARHLKIATEPQVRVPPRIPYPENYRRVFAAVKRTEDQRV